MRRCKEGKEAVVGAGTGKAVRLISNAFVAPYCIRQALSRVCVWVGGR